MKPGKFSGGMGGGFNMNALMKQAQKMQEDMLKTQEELENREYSATAGGGAVEATVRGTKEIASIKISPEIVDPEDIDMLQDLVLAAVNEALKKAQDASAEEMKKVTGGAGLPGMF